MIDFGLGTFLRGPAYILRGAGADAPGGIIAP